MNMEKSSADDAKNVSSRRGMLFGAAATGTAVAAAATLSKIAPQEAAAVLPKAAPENGGGYHASEHVKHYYRTTLI